MWSLTKVARGARLTAQERRGFAVGQNVLNHGTLRRSDNSQVAPKDLFAGKKVVVVGVPGAFTPVCSKQHLPGFIEKSAEIRATGIDNIVAVTVNDAFVTKAWEETLGAKGKVTILADPTGSFTKALGMEVDLSVAGLGVRSKRYSMVVENGVIKSESVEEMPSALTSSSAEATLAACSIRKK